MYSRTESVMSTIVVDEFTVSITSKCRVLERLGWNTWRGVEYRFFALPEDSYVWARSLGNLG